MVFILLLRQRILGRKEKLKVGGESALLQTGDYLSREIVGIKNRSISIFLMAKYVHVGIKGVQM